MGFGKRFVAADLVRLPKTKVNKAVKKEFEKLFPVLSSAKLIVGVDPGVVTGFAIYDQFEKQLTKVASFKIHEAFEYLLQIKDQVKLVRVEDARQRTSFGDSGREKLQGAGSIKRDSKIWEDFLTDYKIPFQMIAPKNIQTKVDAERFKRLTGWEKSTNNHARDGAMMCYKYDK